MDGERNYAMGSLSFTRVVLTDVRHCGYGNGVSSFRCLGRRRCMRGRTRKKGSNCASECYKTGNVSWTEKKLVCVPGVPSFSDRVGWTMISM